MGQIDQTMTLYSHARVEEEIFYPAVRAAADADPMMDEADVEHAGVKDLVAQLEDMNASDDHYKARVTVLGEYVDHHVKEEEEKTDRTTQSGFESGTENFTCGTRQIPCE